MATQVQWRGGSTAEHATFTGAAREVTVDTQKQTLVVHDGSTVGGEALLREDQANLPGSVTNGIYTPGTNQVAVATNGTGRLFVDASGRVSIGSSASGSPLNVSEQGASGAPIFRFIGNAGNGNYLRGGWFASDNTTQLAQLSVDGTVAMYAGTVSSTPVLLTTNNTERLRITAAGLVGIGSSVPSTNLHIGSGSGTGLGVLLSRGATTNFFEAHDGTKTFIGGTDDTNAFVKVGSLSNHPVSIVQGNLSAIYIDTSKRVGIGSTAPNEKLTVADSGSANVYIALQNSTTGTTSADGWYLGATGTEFQIYGKENGPITFSLNSSEKARIDSSGRLLVGTSSAPSVVGGYGSEDIQLVNQASIASIANISTANSAFGAHILLAKSRGGTSTVVQNGDIYGQIRWAGADGTDISSTAGSIEAVVDGTPGPNDMPGRLVFNTTAAGASSPTERMRIDSSGNVGIGGATSPLGTLDVRGNTYIGTHDAATVALELGVGATGDRDVHIDFVGDTTYTDFGLRLIRNGGANGGSIIGSRGTGALTFQGVESAPFVFVHGISTERARIDSSGRLLVGTSTSVPNSNGDAVQVAGAGGTNFGASRFVNTFAGPEVSFYKSRNGTVGGHTVVQTDDLLGSLYFYGSSDSNYQEGARITAAVEAGTKSASSMPGRLTFSTTADGASSPTERMRIKSSGIINFSNAPVYADNAAALAGGLVAGDVYRKADGTLMITF